MTNLEGSDELTRELISAVRSISHGGSEGPLGLEMLSMALDGGSTGDVIPTAVGPALHRIADAIEDLASAVREHTQEIRRD